LRERFHLGVQRSKHLRERFHLGVQRSPVDVQKFQVS
jgi:hypothetical protein